MFFRSPPAPFTCVMCGCEQVAYPFTRTADFQPPICRSCSRPYGTKQRVSGMTRGDHRQLMRLLSIAEGLEGLAGRIEWSGGRHGQC